MAEINHETHEAAERASDKAVEEPQHAIGSPSYKDLVEENAYLRSERSQLYDELARVSSGSSSSETSKLAGCHCAALTETLQSELSKERSQNKKFIAHFEYLKNEIAHLQVHGNEQAAVAKCLEERLEQSEEGLHAANAELLQILPLRIKLNETRQKMESVSQEMLVTNNEMHEVRLMRDKLQMQLDASQQLLEASQNKLVSTTRKKDDLKIEKKDLLNHIRTLDEKLKESSELNESQAATIKQQEERITEIATDSAHWERKSTSLSRELGRFSGSQIQQVTQYTELKEAYAVLKSKLQLREEAINSMIEQSRLSRQQQKPFKRTLVTACVTGTPGPPSTHNPIRWPTENNGIHGNSVNGNNNNNHNSNNHTNHNNNNSVNGTNNNSNKSNTSVYSAKNSTKGKIVFENTEMAEEMKMMMDSSNRDQGDEDYDDASNPNGDMCGMCESFSFLSGRDEKKVNANSSNYGMI